MFSSDRRIRPVSDMKLPVYHGKSSIFNLIISALLTKAHNMRILVSKPQFDQLMPVEENSIPTATYCIFSNKCLFPNYFCMLGNFSCFFCCCLLLSADFFSKLTFSKNSFRNPIRVSNGLDQDQDRHSVSPDLGPNHLQRLTVDDKNRR